MATRTIHLIVLAVGILLGTKTCLFAAAQDPNDKKGVFEMSLEELMNVEVTSTATLTETTPRLVPAPVTTVTQEQIKASGARSLFELLDIYVPNLEWWHHHWEQDQMGLRGIINDRDDKYLLLVNGRSMNQRTHFGAISEQDMVLLSDIHHIDIVRGPGSALYGPGAISMVINIVTFNANNFQGTEVTSRAGVIESFATGEVKHAEKFAGGDGGVFVYAGMGDYDGASASDAPQISPFTSPSSGGSAPFGTIPGDGTIVAGKPMISSVVNGDGESAPHVEPVKLHVEITKGDWDIWARYTRGGKQFVAAESTLARSPYGGSYTWWDRYVAGEPKPDLVPNFYAYQQLTGFAGYTQELSDTIDIDYAFSYSTISTVKERQNIPVDDYREDSYYAKAVLKWQPNENHKIAFGPEYYHYDLGLTAFEGFDWRERTYFNGVRIRYPYSQEWGRTGMPTWSTDMYSLLAEWQWKITEQWTTFLGARMDDHTFTNTMFSPRAALVYTPTAVDTLKAIWTQSVRTNTEADMKKKYDGSGLDSDPEELRSTELRYERQQTKNLDLAASVYYHKLNIITWDSWDSTQQTNLVGTQKDWGIELEASYHTEKDRFMASYGFTKLIDFDLRPGRTTSLSAEPYGYGNDLTNWANHVLKLIYQRKLDAQWTVNASLHAYWGFQGLKDYDQYNPGNPRVSVEGWERASRGSYWLDLGLQYKPDKHLEVGLNGYNLLGIFERDLNKRNYIQGGGDFRDAAPALGLSVSYAF
jgi:outer membrane receptor protein involved in Fe transport